MEYVIKAPCPKCKTIVSEIDYFCSNCGRSLRARPEDTSISKQILVYFISFFLAPFGLGYVFKYMNRSDKKSKLIGAVSLILTFFAIIAVILISKTYLEQVYGTINQINYGGL